MATPLPLADFICAEHAFQPCSPRALLLGRQTVPFGAEALEGVARKWSLRPGRIDIHRVTSRTLQNSAERRVDDNSLFRLFGVESIEAIYHSDLEGTDIILDLCKPIPPEFEGQFDFIFNGSLLDNVFNIATAARNIGRLLACRGRVLHIETVTTIRYSYSAISSSWFFDCAVVNGWADCRVYMGSTRDWTSLRNGPRAMLAFDPSASDRPNAFTRDLGAELGVHVILAEKKADSRWDQAPTQANYRSDADWARSGTMVEPMRRSLRPLHLGHGGMGEPIPSLDNVWLSCDYW